MRKHTRIIIATTAAAGLFLPLTACGSIQDKVEKKVAEEIAGKALGGDVDIDTDGEDGSVSFTDEDGSSMNIGGKSLPEEWPADLPVPENHEILTSMTINDPEEGPSTMVTFTGDGDVAELAEQLSQALNSSGYASTGEGPNTIELGDMTTDMRTYESASNTVMLTVMDMGEDDEPLTIQYLVGVPDADE